MPDKKIQSYREGLIREALGHSSSEETELAGAVPMLPEGK